MASRCRRVAALVVGGKVWDPSGFISVPDCGCDFEPLVDCFLLLLMVRQFLYCVVVELDWNIAVVVREYCKENGKERGAG